MLLVSFLVYQNIIAIFCISYYKKYKELHFKSFSFRKAVEKDF